jgi:hypothetical protein
VLVRTAVQEPLAPGGIEEHHAIVSAGAAGSQGGWDCIGQPGGTSEWGSCGNA